MASPAPRIVDRPLALGFAVLLACLAGACHDSSGGGIVGFHVMASPAGNTFTGPSTMVSLRAVGNMAAGPTIHYTTDLSEPTAMSPVYTGPFMINATTVVKAIAINPDMTESDLLVKGYVLVDGPFRAAWAESGHGDIAGEPFRHWDEDGDVQTSCARCHGAGGLEDYAEDGTVDLPGGLPLGLDCDGCHEAAPLTLHDWRTNYPAVASVEFPSSAEVDLGNASNLCIACHQGRESGQSIDDDIMADPAGPYTFVNIHYYAAGASYFGAETNGGYQYAGLQYAGRNPFAAHGVELQDYMGCHMRGDMKDHSFMPRVQDCTGCHTGSSFSTLSGTPSASYQAIRATEPQLLEAIQAYADGTLGFPIAYSPTAYPYFVHDLNGNGEADADELGFANRYDEFDDKLLKAAYNYQASAKEPGGYIHNGVYIRQLLHDSLVDLGAVPEVPAPGRDGFDADLATVSEQWHVSGHSDSTAEAFRHWDGDGEVSTSCARCHTSSGFVDHVEDGVVDAAAPLGEVIECSACHAATNLYVDSSTRFDDLASHPALEPVEFPSGLTGTFGDASNVCMTCHQGRESGASIDAATPNGTVQAPTDYPSYNFINRHYYAAAAILFGSDVTAAYEYPGRSYMGRNTYLGHQGVDNPNAEDSCLGCHMRNKADHRFRPEVDDCTECHQGITSFDELGVAFGQPDIDYDGDGMGESFDAEIKGMADNLYAAIQAYAMTGLPQNSPVVYEPAAYPYWFKDTNGDGMVSPGEANFGNRYTDFDLELLRAAFNFHSGQDPCGDIHNFRYVLQTLYDSADVLDDGVLNFSAMGTRP